MCAAKVLDAIQLLSLW